MEQTTGRHADTITPPLPRNVPDNYRTEVEAIVDARIQAHVANIENAKRLALRDVRKDKMKTMGLGAAAGLAVGIGGVLLTQKIRRRGGSPK